MTARNPEPLVLRRSYDAPRERVFEAWTDAKQMERWYTPEIDAPVVIARLDVRPGGGYRVEFGAAPGEPPYVEVATYVEVVPPSRLVFDAVLTLGSEVLAETRNELDFIDLGGRTEIVMTETGTPPDVREDRRDGWSRLLDNLPRVLA